jgi:hypothetical protein
MLSNITQPLKSKEFKDYYRKDFKFLTEYLLEFKDRLDILIDDCLGILYQKHRIATISVEFSSEKLRFYKIALYPEYPSFPFEGSNYNGYYTVELYQEFRTEDHGGFSVIVGPELLHWWCHRIIWGAANVIGYKSLH